ncbi:MAG: cobalamin-dependent protein, partial [Candidatus Eremiobacteraeota bacterium]|nr:cobalamin-dependent protein [Candidatus Eremiobacteraeota bacterium]
MVYGKKKNIPVIFFLPLFPGAERINYTLGTAYMAAFLHNHGIKSTILPKEPQDLISILKEIKALGARILGITTYDQVYSQVKQVAKMAKAMMPELLVICGGPTATFADRVILKDCNDIDLAVRGEGEESILDIYRFINGEMCLEEIPGITYRAGTEIIRNPDRPLIGINAPVDSQLDILPSPYESGILTGKEFGSGIQSSRGCVYRCTYCDGPAMFGYRVRFHSIDRVLN